MCDQSGNRYLRTLHREEAEALHAVGSIEVDEKRG
ncbi:MAG: hypothetical protein JWN34_3778, partial [Bryobacterales bacterium]|nr:hypothetical protein [Bryobacterales bacterium]